MMIKYIAAVLALTTTALWGTSALAATDLPDVPVPLKSATGAMHKGVIYVGLGTAGQSWYKIDTKVKEPKWEAIASFPDAARDQAQAVALNDKIYVMGGCGKINSDITSVSNEVYAYDIASNKWSKVLTRSPIGLTGHTVTTVDGKNALVVGSVNKAIFDGFFADMDYANKNNDKKLLDKINADYIGKPAKDYFFNKSILQYDPANNLWSTIGELPYYGTAGSAVAVNPKDKSVMVVGGEKKPGLRTATNANFTVEDSIAKLKQVPDLIPPTGEKVQEGVAGASAGYINGTLIVAGGANFPGSTVNYDHGKNFAHQGCTKTYRDEIYTFANGEWVNAGKLAQPLGYAVTIQNGDELLIIGGETTGGTASADVLSVTLDKGTVTVK